LNGGENVSNTCPCCGFKTIDEPFGYEICDICGWEDDPVQLQYPTLKGGANKGSLYEEQAKILKKIPETITDFKGVQRDDEWILMNVPLLLNLIKQGWIILILLELMISLNITGKSDGAYFANCVQELKMGTLRRSPFLIVLKDQIT